MPFDSAIRLLQFLVDLLLLVDTKLLASMDCDKVSYIPPGRGVFWICLCKIKYLCLLGLFPPVLGQIISIRQSKVDSDHEDVCDRRMKKSLRLQDPLCLTDENPFE